MNLAIPVYVEEHKLADEPHPQFRLRPLFFDAPTAVARQLSAGLSKLAQLVRREVDALATSPRHDRLVPWTFAPQVTERGVKFSVQLRRQTWECRLLVVTFTAFDRRVAVAPALDPPLFFEVLRGQDVDARAREVVTDRYRRLEKEEGDAFVPHPALATCRRAWVTSLELDLHPNPSLEAAKADGLLALFSQEKTDGRAELAKVGRCLDWLYPDELNRAVLREAEVTELSRLLAEPDRRPVLLLGPPKVGKTALVHEAVYRRLAERSGPHVAERNVWLLAPPRLISGMSVVGQWEGRVLAILAEAAKREHVLYFDDVLGLYQAGRSADSDLNVAAVMRPWVERRDVRLLAEMTPDAFNVLRERDRGLADQFHVLPVREPTEPQTRRILIQAVRSLEDRHRCRFDAEALPTVMDLEQRYVRDQSMPGKAAGLLSQLALKYRGRDADRGIVLAEFAARSGLSLAFLDQNVRLDRREVVTALHGQIVGQDAALAAMADVVAIAKARLNDPGRPLGTFLFLGPTGVGKTAAAKALARYLYGDEARLLRFDLNEYVDAAAPARLTGTFARPDGLLTAAVRRQPYCVLLLDEVEKAHPAVFDLLLQVLGEGRLTDAVGRTSDFTSAVVIMTSNLGTREAGASFGLRPGTASRDAAFLDAARAFFRPEFFNRIDRVVPFEPLGRDQVAAIAGRLIQDLFRREGLVHRRVVLDVDPAAMTRIVDQGYHPQLGARALKRAIERQLTGPIAARLAAMTPDAPTVVSIYPSGDEITPHVQPLVYAAPLPRTPAIAPAGVDGVLTGAEEFLNAVEAANVAGDGHELRVSADALSPEHFRYFAVREQIERIDRMIRSIDQAATGAPTHVASRRTPRARPQRRMRRVALPPAEFAAVVTAGEAHARLAELWEAAAPAGESLEERAAELVLECAELQAMAGPAAERALVHLRPFGSSAARLVDALRDAYAHLFASRYGFSATPLLCAEDASHTLLLEMPGVAATLAPEAGTHLLYPPGENAVPLQVLVLPLAAEQDAKAAGARLCDERRRWRAGVARGEHPPDTDPHPLAAVVRVYDSNVATLDLRTGLMCAGLPTGEDLRRLLLAALPAPAGLAAVTAVREATT
jgi:ATP-dependent Clp protease ATP-binding subunit ClpA